MTTVGSRARLRWILLSVFAALIAVFLAVGFALGDRDVRTTRGSLSYYLMIAAPIRDVPVVAPDEEPVYEARTGDGARMGELSISYRTRAQDSVIRAATKRYFESLGYRTSEPGVGEPTYEQPGSHVYLSIEPEGAGMRRVVVREVQ